MESNPKILHFLPLLVFLFSFVPWRSGNIYLFMFSFQDRIKKFTYTNSGVLIVDKRSGEWVRPTPPKLIEAGFKLTFNVSDLKPVFSPIYDLHLSKLNVFDVREHIWELCRSPITPVDIFRCLNRSRSAWNPTTLPSTSSTRRSAVTMPRFTVLSNTLKIYYDLLMITEIHFERVEASGINIQERNSFYIQQNGTRSNFVNLSVIGTSHQLISK